MDTMKEHIKNTFTPYEIAMLKYFYLCIVYDGSKFCILLIFFSFFHLFKDFCMCIVFLLSLRNFWGGLHFKHYMSCFAFTFAFTGAGIALSNLVVLDNRLEICLLIVTIAVSAVIAPVTSQSRPALSKKQSCIYHCCGLAVLLFYFVLFLVNPTFSYRNLCFWVILLQTLQLIAAKLLMKGEYNV